MSAKSYFMIFSFVLVLLIRPEISLAQEMPSITLNLGDATGPDQVSVLLQILFVLTVLSVAPAILLMTTCFARIVIVLSFIRQAMGLNQMPPNQIIIGLSLFLTFFIMSPVFSKINNQAIQPYLNKKIGEEKAIKRAVQPMREFMLSQVREKDLKLLVNISGNKQPANQEEISTLTLIPAFMLSELKRAFEIGFMIFVPFLVIDMLVASVLMTMGMLMLPPVIISLPFKVLLFVLVDGWNLVVGSLVQSFH